jgi:hypothetical protein
MDPHSCFAHRLHDRDHDDNDHDHEDLAVLLQKAIDLLASIQCKVRVLERDNDTHLQELARASATSRALMTRRLATVQAEKKVLRAALHDSQSQAKDLACKVVDLTQAKRLLVDEVERLTVKVQDYKDAAQEEELQLRFLVEPIHHHTVSRCLSVHGPVSEGNDTADSSYMSTIYDSSSCDDHHADFGQLAVEFGDENDRLDQCRWNGSTATMSSYVLQQLDGDKVREASFNLSHLSGPLLDSDIPTMEDELLPGGGDDEELRPLNQAGDHHHYHHPQPVFLQKIVQLFPFDWRARDGRNSVIVDEDGDSSIASEQWQDFHGDNDDGSITKNEKQLPWWLSLGKGSGKIAGTIDGSGEADDCPLIAADEKRRGDLNSSRPFWLMDQWMLLPSGDSSNNIPSTALWELNTQH